MIKSDSEKQNLMLPIYGLFFSIGSKLSFIYTIPQIGLCYTSHGELAGTRSSSPGIDLTTQRPMS